MINLEDIRKKKPLKELLEFSIINVDKPSGPTSFIVSDKVRKILNLRKTSHFGTLDPKVTGVLPIALNRACKLTGYFLGHDKTYIGIMRFHEEINFEDIKKAINKKFLGKIMQKPPVRSRVKRQFREREVKKFEILESNENGKDFLFLAEVQGGTYIRKLIDDLGNEIGIGAHMLELRRIKAGIFSEEKSFTLYALQNAMKEFEKGNEIPIREMLIPGEIISEIYPSIQVEKQIVKRLLNGSPIFTKEVKEKLETESEKICVFSGESFIGIYNLINKGDLFAKPDFVLRPLE